jgi:uncharacterized protein
MPTDVRDVVEGELPIFALEADGDPRLFYAPGYLALVARREAEGFARRLAAPEAVTGVAAALRQRAAAALAESREIARRPFSPTCLTLYLHDGCNLRCGYCVTAAASRPTRRLELSDVRAAAAVVIANCVARRLPFTVVLHGGGEPTLEPRLLFDALDVVEAEADARGVPTWRYVATNGVMTRSLARRVARRVDLVGLSCDGPPDVQAIQRPPRLGGSSARSVEATADVVHETGTPLHVRATVLPGRVHRLAEIAEYLCARLHPEEIAAEPVYVGGRATAADAPEPGDVDRMVDAFIGAEAVALSHGVRWTTSGSRLAEVHGPYCHVFRDVLNLVPGGAATACFKTPDATAARRAGVDVRAAGGRFAIDEERVATLRRRLAHRPACDDCFNRFHCTGACPDQCRLTAVSVDGFRCRFQRLLALRRLRALAAAVWPGEGTTEIGVPL